METITPDRSERASDFFVWDVGGVVVCVCVILSTTSTTTRSLRDIFLPRKFTGPRAAIKFRDGDANNIIGRIW